VIAIEIARLFETEQASKRELQEALEYQTATSSVLGVISRSPNDVQPVLEAIARTTRNLCAAERATVWRLDGDGLRPVAFSGIGTDRVEEMRAILVPVEQGSMPGRALRRNVRSMSTTFLPMKVWW